MVHFGRRPGRGGAVTVFASGAGHEMVLAFAGRRVAVMARETVTRDARVIEMGDWLPGGGGMAVLAVHRRFDVAVGLADGGRGRAIVAGRAGGGCLGMIKGGWLEGAGYVTGFA